jgi:glycerol uptake facilitator-like aquaporin
MAVDLYTIFLGLFVLLFLGLGVSNFVEMKNEQDQTMGRPFFAILFIVLALGLILYKITNP